jgi:hypothetical protein
VEKVENQGFLRVSYADIERVQEIAYKKKDLDWADDAAAMAAAEILIEFCDVLLGRTTVDGFLRAQDMGFLDRSK